MKCPCCSSTDNRKLKVKTNLGYDQYRCKICERQFNERTGTVFNFIEYPTEIVMLAVYYYHRFKLSLDDVVEIMSHRDINISRQTVQNWAQLVGVNAAIKIRQKRQGKVCGKWHIDATYIKDEGRWCYLYRAIDKDGKLVEVMLSDVRDQAAAERFLRQCEKTTGMKPFQITTDKESAFYPAIKKVFPFVFHRDVKYKNNNIEADHCGIKSRYGPMKGFKNPLNALVFCTIFEELRQFFNLKKIKRSDRSRVSVSKINELTEMMKTS